MAQAPVAAAQEQPVEDVPGARYGGGDLRHVPVRRFVLQQAEQPQREARTTRGGHELPVSSDVNELFECVLYSYGSSLADVAR